MKYTKFKTVALAVFIVTFYACNDNSSDSSSTAVATDTSQSSTTTDTAKSSMSDTSMKKNSETSTMSSKKKRLKASLEKIPESKHDTYTADKAGVYSFSQVMPAYDGGSSAIEDYINNHINYPQPALDDAKEGKVNVKFIINEDGVVKNAHSVSPKLGDGLDEEAVRVVSSMPKWKPGTVMGRPVKVSMTLPIIFKSEEQ